VRDVDVTGANKLLGLAFVLQQDKAFSGIGVSQSLGEAEGIFADAGPGVVDESGVDSYLHDNGCSLKLGLQKRTLRSGKPRGRASMTHVICA
jgi:hypothetical protein